MQDTILVLGSGALKIGEAGEFDYSGTQAIKALKEEGKRVILINPNIATIQTSDHLADEIYFLPVTPLFVERVIQKEKPHGILLSFGGQTALNCGMALHKAGILEKYGVTILGTPIEAIVATEDREQFSKRLHALGILTAKGDVAADEEKAVSIAQSLGYPVMVRAGFALGGAGSGIARNETELRALCSHAFAVTSQIIVEECLSGWKEVEYEVVRDCADNCITVCNMENFDPVGIHTGESIVVAPSQTLTNDEYFMLRQASIDVIRNLKIVGECNIQFALDPESHAYRVIEVNARLSRSSALASKATGYPLAYVAAKLALGKTLPELPNSITKTTTAFFEPALDYIVVKMPRWDLEKYTNVEHRIGSEMKSVGEVMSIGRTFEEAIQKACRMLNDGYQGVIDKQFSSGTKKELLAALDQANSLRLFTIVSAIRAGCSLKDVHAKTKVDPWFLAKLENIVNIYAIIEANKARIKRHCEESSTKQSLLLERSPRRVNGLAMTMEDFFRTAKQTGFSDKQIADILGVKEDVVRKKRIALGITPWVKRIDTMAGEFPAKTSYLYCTYHGTKHDHVVKAKEERVMVIGCGPYAIGTSVEFDWCAVTTSLRLRHHGVKSIMVNCNPETVSTDYDLSDYLYFEELTYERVMDICDIEQSPVIVSVGGQIPNNLAPKLAASHVKILGTNPRHIEQAEDRQQFSTLLDSLGMVQPVWTRATSISRATAFAAHVGYPVLVRPSFVLSGKAMSVLYSEKDLMTYLAPMQTFLKENPVVISKFIIDARECDVDGVAHHGNVVASTISEHIENGGVHSGDSTVLQPTYGYAPALRQTILGASAKIIGALHVDGPWNIQFLLVGDTPYVIECNLRASRSFPFVSKVLQTNFINLATDIALGKEVQEQRMMSPGFQAIKVPQFSFHKLRNADPALKVEMSSTGEVCAFGDTPYDAYLKAILATGVAYPSKKAVFVSLGGARGKLSFLASCQTLATAGYTMYATDGTTLFLKEHGISATRVAKVYEHGHHSALQLMEKKMIDFVVITPDASSRGQQTLVQQITDGYMLRRHAIDHGVAVFTNTETAALFVHAITSHTPENVSVKSWNTYKQVGTKEVV